MGLTCAHEHVVSYHRSSSQFKTYDHWLQNKLIFLVQYDPKVSVWAHELSRKIFAEVETELFSNWFLQRGFLQPQLAPSAGLTIECRLKALWFTPWLLVLASHKEEKNECTRASWSESECLKTMKNAHWCYNPCLSCFFGRTGHKHVWFGCILLCIGSAVYISICIASA